MMSYNDGCCSCMKPPCIPTNPQRTNMVANSSQLREGTSLNMLPAWGWISISAKFIRSHPGYMRYMPCCSDVPALAVLSFAVRHAGFGMLETGSCRAKNASNVLMKNLVNVCVGTLGCSDHMRGWNAGDELPTRNWTITGQFGFRTWLNWTIR